MKNILVVDDDSSMRNLLVDYLSQNAFGAKAVENSQQLTWQMAAQEADLVIVDLNLRQEDGLQIVRNLSTKSDIPIIIISGDRLDEADKVIGFELGASDYIAKPFSLMEFLARVKVAMREKPERKGSAPNKIFTFDNWRVNTRHRRLTDPSGETIKLTASEFNLLMAFLNAPRQILSREQLLLATRMYDQEIYDRSVDVLILRLRRKLEQSLSTPKYIRTERGAGYIFEADVVVENPRVRLQ
ncbi:response regulator [Rhizobium sp. NFACC06-2]|uniref:response regulator n=1 Tax=Rhizobium sp. NFACC06-2 TaxID=1566264 RepID=UPI0008766F38|nr:response regulator [Rhizobium sp. NFACC06-2]SCY90280.1 DNA-binding response regulator, OmpR family, contains REC and winged-helix (wHTH) domain [Rhizobium sp. NFACC06-2]SCY92296.1 DNA-binding response regulator, OmpR family, contains REC and winged-helix (wHTH) domain [Rhizobium sp. NFACC06-2]SCY92367.1 DNA-binding response regulator, OmpR family, contains REC and winged-helix (wHTH) domain [Rhizobium sp. NFACC06-2]